MPRMMLRTRFSWVRAFGRHATGRRARRIYIALILVLVVFSGGVRVRSYLLTRRFQAVLSGLEKLKVDATSEEQLLKTVPYLVRDPRDSRLGTHVHRYYRVNLSNADDMQCLNRVSTVMHSLLPVHQDIPGEIPRNKWGFLDLPSKAAYVLGLRHLSFDASVSLLDGTVSSIWYDIEPDVFLGWPVSYLVMARSAHGFWRDRGLPVPVYSNDDESPEYRFGYVAGESSRADNYIRVTYTPDASRKEVSHAFQVDLSCFWSLRGCDSVRQVVPLLWKDREETMAATAARLTPKDPCPDRILAGRVRSLPDLNVALLEVVSSREVEINHEGDISREIATDYRLKDAILGHDEGPWTDIRYRQAIPWPQSPTGSVANPIGPAFPKAGDRFLYFGGAIFDSCRIVPATHSAEAAIRTSIPAPRRIEDDMSWMWGRM
jgi:hypothetical protein